MTGHSILHAVLWALVLSTSSGHCASRILVRPPLTKSLRNISICSSLKEYCRCGWFDGPLAPLEFDRPSSLLEGVGACGGCELDATLVAEVDPFLFSAWKDYSWERFGGLSNFGLLSPFSAQILACNTSSCSHWFWSCYEVVHSVTHIAVKTHVWKLMWQHICTNVGTAMPRGHLRDFSINLLIKALTDDSDLRARAWHRAQPLKLWPSEDLHLTQSMAVQSP